MPSPTPRITGLETQVSDGEGSPPGGRKALVHKFTHNPTQAAMPESHFISVIDQKPTTMKIQPRICHYHGQVHDASS